MGSENNTVGKGRRENHEARLRKVQVAWGNRLNRSNKYQLLPFIKAESGLTLRDKTKENGQKSSLGPSSDKGTSNRSTPQQVKSLEEKVRDTYRKTDERSSTIF